MTSSGGGGQVAKRRRQAPDRPQTTLSTARPSRWAPLDPQVAVLPLRLFLGVTFFVAGVQKLADPNFFRAGVPGSIQSQLHAAVHTAALPGMVRLAEHAPVAFGATIAVAEIAVGLGTVCGLWARVASSGGLCLSLVFFLTVSFGSWPYYYGSDIVFVFAWTPLVLGGPGRYALDDLRGRPAPDAAAMWRPAGVPVPRRMVLSRGAAAAALAGVGVAAAAVAAAVGRARTPGPEAAASGGGSSGAGGSSSVGPPAPGTPIGPASGVPVGGAEAFTDPATGQPAFALQLTAGHFTARSAICTHQGCTVQFSQQDETFVCPCHGSVFDARDGRVLQGPAPSPLPAVRIAEGGDGRLYVDGG